MQYKSMELDFTAVSRLWSVSVCVAVCVGVTEFRESRPASRRGLPESTKHRALRRFAKHKSPREGGEFPGQFGRGRLFEIGRNRACP